MSSRTKRVLSVVRYLSILLVAGILLWVAWVAIDFRASLEGRPVTLPGTGTKVIITDEYKSPGHHWACVFRSTPDAQLGDEATQEALAVWALKRAEAEQAHATLAVVRQQGQAKVLWIGWIPALYIVENTCYFTRTGSGAWEADPGNPTCGLRGYPRRWPWSRKGDLPH